MTDFDPWAQLRLLDLQAADTSIDRLNAQLAQLPEQLRAREVASAAESARLAELEQTTALADLELEVSKAEADVEAVRQRAARNQSLLDSGSISDSKQLTDLQHELATLARRQTELEDIEIEVMQTLEQAQTQLAATRADVASLTEQLSAAMQAAEAATHRINTERDALQQQRAAVAAELPADLLKLYERIRTDNNGIGAAHLQQGRCQGCRIQLDAVALSAVRKATPSELVRCNECRAILIRNAESGL